MKQLTIQKIIATGLGAGYCPVAPGTAGALLATAVWGFLYSVCPFDVLQLVTLMFVIAFTLAGIWASDGVIPLWGDDPKRVVVDEMVGVWIALLGAVEGSIGYPIAAFCLFRFFDITKPLGIRRMEELHGGLGVMADDILAGVYALFVLLLYRSITI